MATSADVRDEDLIGSAAGKSSGVALAPLALAVMVAVGVALTATVAGGYWFVHSGRLSSQGTTPKAAAVAQPAVAAKSHSVVLDPLLVNLADAGGNAYLRVSITLRVQDEATKDAKSKEEKPEKGKPVNEFEAAERDAALDAIGRLTAVELLQLDGKDKLKRQLATAMMKRVPELKVSEIFFTEFLVQQ